VCLCTVGMIDLFVEICGSAPFARAHGPRNDRCLFEMSLSICTECHALEREREREREREKESLFVFRRRFSNHESLCDLTFMAVGFRCVMLPANHCHLKLKRNQLVEFD